MTYVAHGRCRSGRRWFWIAAKVDYSNDHHCDDPVCGYGGPHAYGWEETEELALKAMSDAVAELGGEFSYGRAGTAADALKRINAARRAARPPRPGGDETSVVEYLYEADVWWDDYGGEHRKINEIPVAKKTAKRIYFRDHSERDYIKLAYISRRDLETDTRCPGAQPYNWERRCEHGYYNSHGYAPGEIWYRASSWSGGHLFATREAAEESLYRWERERDRQRPLIRQLRMEMANAHPDRGGSSEAFIAARKRYDQALASLRHCGGATEGGSMTSTTKKEVRHEWCLTVAADWALTHYQDVIYRGYLKEHPSEVIYRLDLLAGMISVVRAQAQREFDSGRWGDDPGWSAAGLDEHHHALVEEWAAHDCNCEWCASPGKTANDIPGLGIVNDEEALAWYRRTFDDDAGDDTVLARLQAWTEGRSAGPFEQGVPLRPRCDACQAVVL
jgi:hypothetical protein